MVGGEKKVILALSLAALIPLLTCRERNPSHRSDATEARGYRWEVLQGRPCAHSSPSGAFFVKMLELNFKALPHRNTWYVHFHYLHPASNRFSSLQYRQFLLTAILETGKNAFFGWHTKSGPIVLQTASFPSEIPHKTFLYSISCGGTHFSRRNRRASANVGLGICSSLPSPKAGRAAHLRSEKDIQS